MGKFHNKELEKAYEHFLSVMEQDCSEERDDVEQLEKVLRKWDISSFHKEYEGGFIVEWDKSVEQLMCQCDGVKLRLKDHKPKVLKKGCECLPDFWQSLSEQK